MARVTLLEFIKMYPIVFCDYKVKSGKLKNCAVLAKNILKPEY